MNKLPILYFHLGYQPYLEFTLAQTRASNPNSRLILLGDRANRRIAAAEHRMAENFFAEATAFAELYRHRSTNPYTPELRCFQRWYAFLELMQEENLPEALICDSDIMLFADFSRRFPEERETDCALSVPADQEDFRWCACPHLAYWKIDALRQFCEFNNRIYREDDPRLAEKWRRQRESGQPGGICDMTALYLFFEGLPRQRKRNLLEVRQGETIDLNIGSPDNLLREEFLMADGRKKIEFKNGLPRGFHLPTQETVGFQALHCQGGMKWLMPSLYRGTTRLTKARLQVFARYGLAHRWRRLRKVVRFG